MCFGRGGNGTVILNVSDMVIFYHIGTKDLPVGCLYFTFNLHDFVLPGSRIATLGNGGYSHWWLGPLKLCPVRYLTTNSLKYLDCIEQ